MVTETEDSNYAKAPSRSVVALDWPMISISVIVPLFNKELYIRATVEALKEQLKQTDEIIVVDDCSTDNSLDLLEDLSSNCIRILKTPSNSGPATARNLGAAAASCRYLLFFDADDQPHPNLLHVLRKTIEMYPAEVFFSFDIAFEAHGETNMLGSRLFDFEDLKPNLLKRDAFAKSCLAGKPLCTASSTCVKAESFNNIKGFKPGLRYCEDTELWVRLSAAYRLVYIPAILAVYRDVPKSLSYGLRAKPGSVQPFVESLLQLSDLQGDVYHQLARSMIVKNTIFSLSMGGGRLAVLRYLRSVKIVMTSFQMFLLCLIAFIPRTLLRIPFAFRSWLAKRRINH